MTAILAVLTATSMLLVLYHHALWPVLLGRLARQHQVRSPELRPRRYRACADDAALPSIAILVPAFNEAGVIADKIYNLAALDYPPDRLRLIIACDGCTDETAALARTAAALPQCGHLQLEIRESAVNKGKVQTINEIIPPISADLVGLSDASALISLDALLLAARHFADRAVGVVSATYRLLEPGSAGEAAYWDYQLEIKEHEAALGAPLGAHGAFYLFRRELFHLLPCDTINDDFILPMTMVAADHRAIYEPRMVAIELERAAPETDRRRRQRIAAGNMQQLLRLRCLLHPRYGGVALAFASGKALRAIMPFLLIISFLGSLALADQSALFTAAAAGQLVLYGLASLRHALPGLTWPKLVESIHYLVVGQLAGLLGATRYVLGLDRRGWSKAAHKARGAKAGPAWLGPAGTGERGAHAPQVRQRPPALRDRRQHGGGPRIRHIHPVVAVVKRSFDSVTALLLLLLAMPLLPLIALAIRLDSSGPIFFRQLRIGESLPDQTRLFQIIKFRTMRTDQAEAPAAVWAADDDPRITRVGNFLRKSRLDELPQLINVLRGEMSIIGPRPEQPGIFRWLDATIPYYSERTYDVRPGITGFAQVSQGYDRTIDDVRSKLNYDHAYALALSRPRAWLDLELYIIARTMLVMAQSAGH